MLEVIQTASDFGRERTSTLHSRGDGFTLTTDPLLDVPGDPAAYARKHPDSIVTRLDLWRERPGLLAHALAEAGEVAAPQTLPLLRYRISDLLVGNDKPVVREGALHAVHAMALRDPQAFLSWGQDVLRDRARQDASEDVRVVALELLEDLKVQPALAHVYRTWLDY